MAMCLSLHLRLGIQSSIVGRIYIRIESNRLTFAILILFVGQSSTRLPSCLFRIISWRPDAWGNEGFQVYQDLLGTLPQLCGGALEAVFQQLDMILEGVMNPFWDFMNEVAKVFLCELSTYV